MNIDDKLDIILNRLDAMEQRIAEIERSSHKMDNHINFVENIYKTIQKPFLRLFNQGQNHNLLR